MQTGPQILHLGPPDTNALTENVFFAGDVASVPIPDGKSDYPYRPFRRNPSFKLATSSRRLLPPLVLPFLPPLVLPFLPPLVLPPLPPLPPLVLPFLPPLVLPPPVPRTVRVAWSQMLELPGATMHASFSTETCAPPEDGLRV